MKVYCIARTLPRLPAWLQPFLAFNVKHMCTPSCVLSVYTRLWCLWVLLLLLQWVTRLLQQGNTVVATARDPSASVGLQKLVQQQQHAAGEAKDKLILTQLEVSDADSIAAWAAALEDKISHVDVSPGGKGGCDKWVLSPLIGPLHTR